MYFWIEDKPKIAIVHLLYIPRINIQVFHLRPAFIDRPFKTRDDFQPLYFGIIEWHIQDKGTFILRIIPLGRRNGGLIIHFRCLVESSIIPQIGQIRCQFSSIEAPIVSQPHIPPIIGFDCRITQSNTIRIDVEDKRIDVAYPWTFCSTIYGHLQAGSTLKPIRDNHIRENRP